MIRCESKKVPEEGKEFDYKETLNLKDIIDITTDKQEEGEVMRFTIKLAKNSYTLTASNDKETEEFMRDIILQVIIFSFLKLIKI